MRWLRVPPPVTLALVGACWFATDPRAAVESVELAALPAVWVGDTRVLQATPRAADGRPLERPIEWSSSNTQVATVDAAGVLAAHAMGTTTLAATCEGKRAELVVAVSDLDLIYEAFADGPHELLMHALSGGQPVRLLPQGMAATRPVPSPDGTKVAFVAGDIANGEGDIFVVNRDGSGLVQLTDDPELDDNPAWSPDGNKIAFRSYRAKLLGDIWVMNADGTNAVNLTPDPLPGVTDERRPVWSPDGARIAFASNRAGTMDIWIMRVDGSDLVQLTNTPHYDTEPTWSPDGARIAFRRSDDTISDILIINVLGGVPVRIELPGHELMPAWSPSGSLLAFAYFSPAGPDPQIYTMRPDGSALTRRTTDPAWKGAIEPGWIRR